MRTLKHIHSVAHRNLPFLIGVCLCLYFSYHLVSGERSFSRLSQLHIESTGKVMTLGALSLERQALEEAVKMMRPGTLSVDVLEENSRIILGYQSDGEVVVFDR